MKISEKEFPSKRFPSFKNWYGEYEVVELTGKELWEIDDVIAKKQVRKGIPIGEQKFDITEYNKHLMMKSCKKDGEFLKSNQIEQMPAKLYQLLYIKTRELNLITEAERNFLFSE